MTDAKLIVAPEGWTYIVTVRRDGTVRLRWPTGATVEYSGATIVESFQTPESVTITLTERTSPRIA